MKLKLILLSTLFISFMSCKDANQTTAETTETEAAHDHDHDHTHDHEHAMEEETIEHDEHGTSAGTELALNNGAKWKSDNPTQAHAEKMIAMAQAFQSNEADANLEMYRNYSQILQNELNGMIKDCKMDGPDHDALHLWLEPVLKGVKSLKDAKNEDEAKEIEADLTENIIKYNQFFN